MRRGPRLTISYLPTITDSRNCGRKVTAAIGSTPQNAPSKNDSFHFAFANRSHDPISVPIKSLLVSPTLYRGKRRHRNYTGKNLTHLNRYSASWVCLAVILAGFDAFLACFACHLGFTSFSARFA